MTYSKQALNKLFIKLHYIEFPIIIRGFPAEILDFWPLWHHSLVASKKENDWAAVVVLLWLQENATNECTKHVPTYIKNVTNN